MAVLRPAHFEVAASVVFTLLVVYVSSAYLTALQLSRKDSFLLELRVPDLQVAEAFLLTVIILLLVWNQTLQDLGVRITCFFCKLASALITSVLLGSFIFRALRVKVLSHSRRRKRFGKWVSPRGMRLFMVLMAIYGLGLLVLQHSFDLCGSEICQPGGACIPFADWYLMGPQLLACVVVLLILGVTESNPSVHDPLQLNLENRQVGTTACLGAAFSFCFITLIDTGVVRGAGVRTLSLLNSISLIVSFVFIFIFSGLLPAMRFGYSPFPGLGRSLSIGVEHARALKEQKTLAGVRLVAKNKREKSGFLGGRAVGGSTRSRSILPVSGAEEPTSKRYMSLRDELFQVLSEKETRLLFFDFCARLMCEEHAQFVYEYHRLTSERSLSSTERHVSLKRMLKLIKDYVARDGMYAMGMSVHMSQSLTLHAATLHAAQHKPSEPRLLEVQDTLCELFAFVLSKLVNSTFVEFREHPPYVDYLTTLAKAARRRNHEATHGDSGRHNFNMTDELRPSDLDRTMMGADDESNVVNMAHVVEEGRAPAGNRVEASPRPPPKDPRSAKARQNELLLHLAQSGNLSKGFKRSLRRMDSDIKAQLNAPRDTPGENTTELLKGAERRGMGASYDMFNSWRIGAAKARRGSISSDHRSSVSEGRDSRDW